MYDQDFIYSERDLNYALAISVDQIHLRFCLRRMDSNM